VRGRRRFGIVCVDFEALERVPKASHHRYRDVLAAQRNGGAPVAEPA
jgi:beta-glucosidase/6-phospho-beta-glucosidase/beta-galactosidase